MLAQMGWSSGQSLGLTMPGLTEEPQSRLQDGQQGHRCSATRARGKSEWQGHLGGSGGDLGSLFERLNAANAASSSASAVASSSSSLSAGRRKMRRRKRKARRKRRKSGTRRTRKRRRTSPPTRSRRRSESTTTRTSIFRERQEEQEKQEGRQGVQEEQTSARKAEGRGCRCRSKRDPALAKDPAAVDEIKKDVVQGRPYDWRIEPNSSVPSGWSLQTTLASVNEILGIASTPSSSAAGTPKATSGTSTPTVAPKTYPGPGGSEVPLMDVDRRLEAEQDGKSDSESSEGEKKDKRKRRIRKTRRTRRRTRTERRATRRRLQRAPLPSSLATTERHKKLPKPRRRRKRHKLVSTRKVCLSSSTSTVAS